MSNGIVHIGPVGGRIALVQEFYARCALETLGAARIPINEVTTFTTFEELIDRLIAHDQPIHVVVNHGTTAENGGLIMPFVTGISHSRTGLLIENLSLLADATGPLRTTDRPFQRVVSATGVRPSTVDRVVGKLRTLRAKRRIVEIRGCNLGASPTLLGLYKRAWGAPAVTAPKCRMFYVPIVAQRPQRQSMGQLSGARPGRARTRRRFLSAATVNPGNAALNAASPLIIDVQDVDGSTNIMTFSFMNDPSRAVVWAAELNGAWRQAPTGARSDRFVSQVMWENSESSYHLPHDPSYRQKLVMV
jgi:hypothetical protein